MSEELTKVVSDENALNDLECDVNEMSYYSQAVGNFSQAPDDFEDCDIYATQIRYNEKSLENTNLKTLFLQIQNLRNNLKNTTNKEICEAFIKTNGSIERVR